ncbi:unnamed protein product [Cylicostephanus goldi]|uniref:Major facilitator superfamily (MFS) profile domain-containing protein n=1 Tax=Cylicostephanus goldi TaxID=71465 RepID=A0A3P6RGX0_CYLGO|nr:unnamed protein product [Cylicostephanus goldi]
MSVAEPSVASRNVMWILIPSLIIDMFAFTCILPLFPSMLNYYAKNVVFSGLLGSLFSALQFLASPTLGALSDVYGRRTMLLASGIGTMISYMIWLRAETFTIFVLSRIVGGLSKANINVATAIVSDVYKPEDNAKGMALIGISYSVGFLIGPMFGAYFSTIAPKVGL